MSHTNLWSIAKNSYPWLVKPLARVVLAVMVLATAVVACYYFKPWVHFQGSYFAALIMAVGAASVSTYCLHTRIQRSNKTPSGITWAIISAGVPIAILSYLIASIFQYCTTNQLAFRDAADRPAIESLAVFWAGCFYLICTFPKKGIDSN